MQFLILFHYTEKNITIRYALNEIIKNANNGILDNKFPIPWENFQNTILVTNNNGLNKINTRIFEIIEL